MEIIFQGSNKPHLSAARKEDTVDAAATLHSSVASHFSGSGLHYFSTQLTTDGEPLARIVSLEKGGWVERRELQVRGGSAWKRGNIGPMVCLMAVVILQAFRPQHVFSKHWEKTVYMDLDANKTEQGCYQHFLLLKFLTEHLAQPFLAPQSIRFYKIRIFLQTKCIPHVHGKTQSCTHPLKCVMAPALGNTWTYLEKGGFKYEVSFSFFLSFPWEKTNLKIFRGRKQDGSERQLKNLDGMETEICPSLSRKNSVSD